MRHIPNIISLFRILLIVPIAMKLHQQQWQTAFLLILVAGISDGVDGFLARAFNWQSRLGSILDPLADKALLVFVFLSLAHIQIIPLWLAILVVARDVIILTGALLYQWVTKSLEMSPLLISKVNTAVQIFYVLAIMYHHAVSPLHSWLINGLQYGVAATTIISGFMYVVIWSGYARNNGKHNVRK